MHVGLLLEHGDARRGGAERYALALADRLAAHGHRVTIASRTGPTARPVRAFPAATRPVRYARRLLPWLRDGGAEVVLTTAPVPGCDLYQPHHGILAESVPPHWEALPPAARLLRRANPWRRAHFALLRRFEARAVAPPTRVLALAPRVVRDLARHHPHARQALLLRPGVDLERFRPAGPGERRATRERLRLPEEPLLLFVGQNYRLKGLAQAIAALSGIDGAVLLVCGDDRRQPFERIARRLRVAGRVRFLGYVPDLPALYRAADALVHPTWYDTAAQAVLEALASGLPAVTTGRDGNADLVGEGGGAVVREPGDGAAVAAAVGRVLALGDAPRERARATAERFPALERLDAVVEAVCGSSS